MASPHFAFKLAAVITATLLATAAIAEDMKLPGPGSDCLSQANTQLTLDNAQCTASFPASSPLYGQCIASAHSAYASAIIWCHYISGAKVSALHANDATRIGALKRR